MSKKMLVTTLTLAFLLFGGAKAQQQPSQDEGRLSTCLSMIANGISVYVYDYRQAGL